MNIMNKHCNIIQMFASLHFMKNDDALPYSIFIWYCSPINFNSFDKF